MSFVRLAGQTAKQATPKYLACRSGHHASTLPAPKTEQEVYEYKIGKREIVGFGWNGLPSYADRIDYPFPAIRWREETPDIKNLRVKEKGDWNKLSIMEKKALYRASFCQTFEEFRAPSGEWKYVIAGGFFAMTIAMWVAVWLRKYVYPPLPITMTEEGRKMQLKIMIDHEVDPVDGLASKWDYENNKWKNPRPWYWF